MIKISVIVPTYNREKVIAKTLNSLLKQTYQDFEVIIVDDGSTDNTEVVVQEYISQVGGDRFKYLKRKNGGQGAARNTGIEHAKGEYVCFLDSDDEYPENSLKLRINAFKEFDIEVSVGRPRVILNKNDSRGVVRKFAYARDELAEKIIGSIYLCNGKKYQLNTIRWGAFGTVNDLTYKKDFLIKIGKFDETIINACDVDLKFRTFFNIKYFAFIDEVLSVYHNYQTAGAIQTSKQLDKHFKSERIIFIKLIKLLNEKKFDRSMIRLVKKRVCSRRYKMRGILAYRNGYNFSALKNFIYARSIYKEDKEIRSLILKSLIPRRIRRLFKNELKTANI